MRKDLVEILEFLAGREDYVIFAGFAAFLHTGVPASPDIDVFLNQLPSTEAVLGHFITRGWKRHRREGKSGEWEVVTALRGRTTFDICWSLNASSVLVPDATTMLFQGLSLRVISREAMFLTRLVSLSSPGRTSAKSRRDRRVLAALRPLVVPDRVADLAARMAGSFWISGKC